MGWLGKLFGSDAVIKKGADMIDNAFYTDQEKAEAHRKMLEAYEPFKLAQRGLAYSIVPAWALGYFICFIIWLTDADYKLDAALEILNGKLGQAAIMILVFYFGGGAISSLGALRK